jgi:asparagine synthase (glutamine-hydrolysing)
MCGMAGIVAYHYAARPVNPKELEHIRDHMAARGPDASGFWLSGNGRAALAHRRLSIIDLSELGSQPMVSADGNLAVTFNGEIYNYRQLRSDLERRGYVFRSSSDTEVLLHLYAQRGADMVADLRGMFAFAIWDSRQGSLFLARDPYGIKPLYYSDDGWTFRFASQVKALLAGGAVSADPDPAGIAGFYLFGAVPEPFTCFTSIRSLPAGSSIVVDGRGPSEIREFFNVSEAYEAAEAGGSKAFSTLAVHEALLDSVRHHLVADVPVGAFLSAGVDSGALVGLMRDAGQSEIKTITLGFAEFENTENDETALAGKVAGHYGTDHARRLVTQQEFNEDLPRILAAMDQPSIDGINTWFVSKAAHEFGLKVAISGLGGDELFGGYSSFWQVPRMASLLKWPGKVPLLPGASRRLASACFGKDANASPKWCGMLEYGGSIEGAYFLRRGLFMPWELPSLIGHEMAREGLRRLGPVSHISARVGSGLKSDFSKVGVLESTLYMRNQLLRDSDWASMAHSLELRVPLVDSMLLTACAPHTLRFSPDRVSRKSLLASSPSLPLPKAVTGRAKTGFSTPIGKWLQNSIRVEPGLETHPRHASRRLAALVMQAAKALYPAEVPACAS